MTDSNPPSPDAQPDPRSDSISRPESGAHPEAEPQDAQPEPGYGDPTLRDTVDDEDSPPEGELDDAAAIDVSLIEACLAEAAARDEGAARDAAPPSPPGPPPSRWVGVLKASDFPHVALDASYRRPVVAFLAKPGDAASDWLQALLDALVRELNGLVALAIVAGPDLPEDVAPTLGAEELPALFGFRQGRRIAELRPTTLPGWPQPSRDPAGQWVAADISAEDLAAAAPDTTTVLREVLSSWAPGPQESAETARRMTVEHEFALTLRSRRLVTAATTKLSDEPRDAERLFRQAWECDPENASAVLGLADAFLEQKRFNDCRRLLNDLSQRGVETDGVERMHARLRIREPFPDPVEDVEMMLDDLTDADAEPTLERLLHAAQAAAALDDFDLSLEMALKVVQRDREVLGPAAQRLMEDVFHIIGFESPLTHEYRSKLGDALE